jgi:hypothetical protein
MTPDTLAMFQAGRARIERRAVERVDGSLWTDYQRLSVRCINLATRCTRLEAENRRLREAITKAAHVIELGAHHHTGATQ